MAKAKRYGIPETGTTTIPIPESWLKERPAPIDQKEFGRKIDYAIAVRDNLIPPPWVKKAAPITEMTSDFVTVRDWVVAETRRMKTAGEIGDEIRIGQLAEKLAAAMRKAMQTAASDSKLRAVGAGYIRNKLRDWKLWPVSSIE
jgi:hypothetical protein